MNKETLTREYIFQALNQLLRFKHYDQISVCDITTKAGVSRMSFYRNFNSKDDLTMQAIDRITRRLKDNINSLEIKNKHTIAKEFFAEFEKYKNVITAFEGSEISKKLLALITEKLRTEFPYDVVNKTSKYIPIYFFGAITSVVGEWLENGCTETPEEMAKFITKMIDIPEKELSPESINVDKL